MSADRATNPFDADGWVGEIELTEEELGPTAPNQSLRIATADPRRLWLCVAVTPLGGTWSIWPSKRSTDYGIRPAPSVDWLLVHNASFPSLVQGEWWIHNGAGGLTVYVITARDMH